MHPFHLVRRGGNKIHHGHVFRIFTSDMTKFTRYLDRSVVAYSNVVASSTAWRLLPSSCSKNKSATEYKLVLQSIHASASLRLSSVGSHLASSSISFPSDDTLFFEIQWWYKCFVKIWIGIDISSLLSSLQYSSVGHCSAFPDRARTVVFSGDKFIMCLDSSLVVTCKSS